MDNCWHCRLTVLGSKARVERFQKSNWNRHLKASHGDLLENSPGRIAWQFETDDPAFEPMRKLSLRWPKLIFLLDYEVEGQREKGLAKAQAGLMAHSQFEY
jgi:hypothetical protein